MSFNIQMHYDLLLEELKNVLMEMKKFRTRLFGTSWCKVNKAL